MKLICIADTESVSFPPPSSETQDGQCRSLHLETAGWIKASLQCARVTISRLVRWVRRIIWTPRGGATAVAARPGQGEERTGRQRRFFSGLLRWRACVGPGAGEKEHPSADPARHGASPRLAHRGACTLLGDCTTFL